MYGSVVSRNCAVGQRLYAHSIPDRSRFSVWREGENKKIGARMTRGCRVPEWQAVASGPNKAKQRILRGIRSWQTLHLSEVYTDNAHLTFAPSARPPDFKVCNRCCCQCQGVVTKPSRVTVAVPIAACSQLAIATVSRPSTLPRLLTILTFVPLLRAQHAVGPLVLAL